MTHKNKRDYDLENPDVCQSCGEKAKVTETRLKKHKRIRAMVCLGCGTKWHTEEIRTRYEKENNEWISEIEERLRRVIERKKGMIGLLTED